MQAPELVADHPINLRDPELLKKNPTALPHMRFLLNDADILSLAFKILIRAPRENNTTQADKSKIDDQLDTLMRLFFKMEKSFKRMKESCKKIPNLSVEDISLMTGPVQNYYKSRAADGFTFEDHV